MLIQTIMSLPVHPWRQKMHQFQSWTAARRFCRPGPCDCAPQRKTPQAGCLSGCPSKLKQTQTHLYKPRHRQKITACQSGPERTDLPIEAASYQSVWIFGIIIQTDKWRCRLECHLWSVWVLWNIQHPSVSRLKSVVLLNSAAFWPTNVPDVGVQAHVFGSFLELEAGVGGRQLSAAVRMPWQTGNGTFHLIRISVSEERRGSAMNKTTSAINRSPSVHQFVDSCT